MPALAPFVGNLVISAAAAIPGAGAIASALSAFGAAAVGQTPIGKTCTDARTVASFLSGPQR